MGWNHKCMLGCRRKGKSAQKHVLGASWKPPRILIGAVSQEESFLKIEIFGECVGVFVADHFQLRLWYEFTHFQSLLHKGCRVAQPMYNFVSCLQEDEDPGWDGFRVMMGDVWPLVKMSHCHTFRTYSGNIHLGCSINHVNHLSSLRHPNMWERFTKFPSILCMWKIPQSVPNNELSFWCTPRNLTWNLTIMVSKRTFLSRGLFSGAM